MVFLLLYLFMDIRTNTWQLKRKKASLSVPRHQPCKNESAESKAQKIKQLIRSSHRLSNTSTGEGPYEDSIASESNGGNEDNYDDLLTDMDSDIEDQESLKMLHEINFSHLVKHNSGFLGYFNREAEKDLTLRLADNACGLVKNEIKPPSPAKMRPRPIQSVKEDKNTWAKGNQATMMI